MYADPSQIRTYVIPVRVNKKELDLITALVNYVGEERAVYARNLLVTTAVEVLHGCDVASPSAELRVG
jgi:hypothetical protein